MNIFMILTIIVVIAVYIIHGVYYYGTLVRTTKFLEKHARNPEEYIEHCKYTNVILSIFWPLYVTHVSYACLCTNRGNKYF